SLRVSLAGPGRIARALARLAAGAIPMDYVVARRAGGSRRTYRIFEEFLSSKGLGEPVGRGSVLAMLERLDAYCCRSVRVGISANDPERRPNAVGRRYRLFVPALRAGPRIDGRGESRLPPHRP